MNILLIKLAAIGDVLFATPFLRAMRECFPEAHIAWLVGSWARPVIADHLDLDEVIVYDGPWTEGGKWAKGWAFAGIAGALRRRRFDLVANLHRSNGSMLLTRLTGARCRLGFDTGRLARQCLTHAVPFDAQRHETDRYLDLLRGYGREVVNRGMSVGVSAETAAWAEEFLRRHGVGPTDLLVGIAPGGGKNPGTTMLFKRWFPERYAAVADALAARHGARILLVGGPDEVELAETMRHSMQTEPILAAGQTTLQQLAGLLHKCRVVLANDSGPLHMAAAAGAATVALFGPSDPRLVAPLGERHRALWHPPECAPCYEPTTVRQIKIWTCHRGDVLCLRQIEVEEVVAAVEEVLDIPT